MKQSNYSKNRLNFFVHVKKIGLIVMLSCLLFSNAVATKELPNIIIFFVDDLGYYDLGFRNSNYYTPNIDAFASESLIFTEAYVPSPTCSPSRAGLYTGKHPASIGFYRHCLDPNEEFNMWDTDVAKLPSRNWLPHEHITYAEVLKKKGYSTHFYGKWHLGPEAYGPQTQGFDEVFSNPHAGHPQNYYPPYYQDGKISDEVEKDKYLTDFFTDKAIDFIKSGKKEKPFLIQLSYQNVHAPNIGKKEFIELYKQKGFEGNLIEYGAQVSAVDQSVGRILNAIKNAGIEENTIVLFASDQGSLYPNTPLRGTKQVGTALYEGGAKIPFIIKWPGITNAGDKNKSHVQTTDIFPTLVEIVGGNPDDFEGLEGRSLVNTIKEEQPLNREALYFYRSYDNQYASVLRRDNYKLIAYRNGEYELFKVDEDISEKNNLVQMKPDVVKELAKLLSDWELKYGLKKLSFTDQ